MRGEFIETFLLDVRKLPDPQKLYGPLGISGERIQKLEAYKNEQSRKQCYGAGLLLSHALRRLTGEFREQGKLVHSAYGKPYFEDLPHVPFNLSHSKDIVILSVPSKELALRILRGNSFGDGAWPLQIGCDVEQICSYRAGVAQRFFTEGEREWLDQQPKSRQGEEFCRLWTRKESVLKLTGLGLALPMDLFDVRGTQIRVGKERLRDWLATHQEKEEDYEKYLCRLRAVKLLCEASIGFCELRHGEYCVCVCYWMGEKEQIDHAFRIMNA